MNQAPPVHGEQSRVPPPRQVQREVRGLARSLALRRHLRLAMRGLWLGLLLIVVGLLLRQAGYATSWPMLMIPAGLIFVSSTLYGWLSRPSLPELARGFDRHFQLRELLATGYEEARHMEVSGAAPGPVRQRLVEQTLLATYQLRRKLRSRPIMPWREVEMLLAVALVGVGLLIAGRPSTLPSVAPLSLQTLPTPAPEEDAQAPPETEEEAPDPASQEQAPLSPEDQATADALSEALRDSGPTRPAADALDRGDTGAAASELRELADQVGQLSPEARSDLAEALRDAAEQLQPTQPDRARRLERQANQIESSPESAAEALDDLAGMIEELGEPDDAASAGEGSEGASPAGEGQTPGEGEGQGDGAQGGGGAGSGLGGESRGTTTDPPSATGEVVPLPPVPEAGGQTTLATGPEGPTVELEAGGTRSSSASNNAGNAGGSDAPLGGEADPLRIPPEYRDVVENYFSPAE